MENKTQLTIGTIITLALLMSTYYIAQDDDAYHCESKDMVMICEKLSSGIGTRCYYDDTYKVCTEGWTKLEVEAQISDNLCYTEEEYTYCCESKQLDSGSCDWIIRKSI